MLIATVYSSSQTLLHPGQHDLRNDQVQEGTNGQELIYCAAVASWEQVSSPIKYLQTSATFDCQSRRLFSEAQNTNIKQAPISRSKLCEELEVIRSRGRILANPRRPRLARSLVRYRDQGGLSFEVRQKI